MISFILKFFFLFYLINGEQRNYNVLMPDLPSTSSFIRRTTQKTYSFPSYSFTKINLFNGPFNIKLYHNIDLNDNYTSIDIETEQTLYKYISVNIEQNNTLTIRMLEKFHLNKQINITILIIYQELNEIYIDGLIHVKSLNPIETNQFRLYNHGNGLIKLQFNVINLDVYLHSISRIKLFGQVYNQTTIRSLNIGDIQCRNLVTKKMNLISNGIGNIYVIAIDEINILFNGMGIIYYSGPLNQQISTGLGNIIQISNLLSLNDQELINEDF